VAGAAGKISTALANITDRNGPNRITVSGTCSAENVNLFGFNRLTIQVGGVGASISNRAFNIINSRNITLRSLTFTGTPNAAALLNLNGSNVLLDGVSVQNGQFAIGINVDTQSTLGFIGAPSLISGNAFAGIKVGAGSTVNVANATISNNGLAGFGFIDGILAVDGGTVVLSNQLNGVDVSVDVSGNKGRGIWLKGGTLTAAASNNPNALIHIHDNVGPGLDTGGGRTEIFGHVKFDGNNPSGSPALGLGQHQIGVGGFLEIGGGVEVIGGIAALFNSTLIIGDTGPMTITGGVTLVYGSVGFVVTGNSIDTLTCDGSSWAFTDGQSTIQTNTCPSNGPGVVSITAGNGISSTGGQMPTLSLDTGVTDARYLQLSGGTLTGGVAALSFTGNGAGLTSLNPASLTAGTAGINISGNAAMATNAAALGAVLPANYARRDVGNAFVGNQSVTGNTSTGSISIGGGTAITQHLSATYSITVPPLKPNTCTNLTRTLNGAVAGGNDTIALGVPGSLMSAGGFLMFQAWESGADAITIRICNVNPNGPASAAVTDTIRLDLWKH